MIKIDKLIPGEYYWVKMFPYNVYTPIIFISSVNTGKHFLYPDNTSMKPEDVHEIWCDPEGNPIAIQRPEKK